jgi:hypothetical protein
MGGSLLKEVVELMKKLVAATPIETLAGVRLGADDLRPPSDDRLDRRHPDYAEIVVAQLGLPIT